jgi:hypothetical protein
MRAWVTSGVRACTLLVVCGCGPSVGIEMEGAASESESESDGSESGLLVPDLLGSVTCEDELDVAALQCVFDALAEGQPMGWRTTLYGTHQFFQDDTWNEYRRLDATTYARFAGHYWFGHSPPSGHTEGSFDAFELPESEWMHCEALADDYHRFMCLHRLAADGEPCADPALLICP